jgi:hypothetical protein
MWSGYNTSRPCTNLIAPYGTVIHEESESGDWIDRLLSQSDGEEVNKQPKQKEHVNEKDLCSSEQRKYPETDNDNSDNEARRIENEEEAKSGRDSDSETSETESYHKISDPASSDSSDHAADRDVAMVI